MPPFSFCPIERSLFECTPAACRRNRTRCKTPCDFWDRAEAFPGAPAAPRVCPRVPASAFLLLGIFSMQRKLEHRNVFRDVILRGRGESVHYAFVLGDETDRLEVRSEMREHGDILALGSPENMNRGKSLEFFAAASACWGRSTTLEWVAKVDDDTYLHFPGVLHAFRPLRGVRDGQFGVITLGNPKGHRTCNNGDNEFCLRCISNGVHSVAIDNPNFCKWGGAFYGFSVDVVNWLGRSAHALRATRTLYYGPEDNVARRWTVLGRRGRRAFALGRSLNLLPMGKPCSSPTALLSPSRLQQMVVVHFAKNASQLRCVAQSFLEARPQPAAACPGQSSVELGQRVSASRTDSA